MWKLFGPSITSDMGATPGSIPEPGVISRFNAQNREHTNLECTPSVTYPRPFIVKISIHSVRSIFPSSLMFTAEVKMQLIKLIETAKLPPMPSWIVRGPKVLNSQIV